MTALPWIQPLSALFGAAVGAAGGIFAGGYRLGRIEARLEMQFRGAVDASEKSIEKNVRTSQTAFDETLKALRQKINDVELDAERRFLLKDDFNDFREEYREDMRDLKGLISASLKP